ncbi:MAG: hypothetical protein IT353_18430 [Gemmatimonadaceae bacterium]|nr:hypothetical protein [Gemmatimonadaceae bacterium]
MPIVAKLRASWGNDSFTADLGFLEEMVQRVLSSRGPFLDCGSGISTVILAALASSDDRVWSLEQDEQWYHEMRDWLALLNLHNVELLLAPLRISGNAVWYSFDHALFPAKFPLVVCDGPSVRRSFWPDEIFRSWRAGVVPELRRRNVSFETIILDDAHDQRCVALIDVWRTAGLHVDTVATAHGSHLVASNVEGRRAEEGRP